MWVWFSFSQLSSLVNVTMLSTIRVKKEYKMDGGNLHLVPFEALISKFKTAHVKRTLQKKTAENDWKNHFGEKKPYSKVPTRSFHS